VSHSIDDGCLYFTVRFTDKTALHLQVSPELVVESLLLSDWSTATTRSSALTLGGASLGRQPYGALRNTFGAGSGGCSAVLGEAWVSDGVQVAIGRPLAFRVAIINHSEPNPISMRSNSLGSGVGSGTPPTSTPAKASPES
jgi:hypothetical protein